MLFKKKKHRKEGKSMKYFQRKALSTYLDVTKNLYEMASKFESIGIDFTNINKEDTVQNDYFAALEKLIEYIADILSLNREESNDEALIEKLHGYCSSDTDKETIMKEVDEYLDCKIKNFVGAIVDIFEDYLEEKNIIIPSVDRDFEIKALLEKGVYATEEEAIKNEGFARIYGENYDEFQTEVEYNLDNIDSFELREIANNIYDCFSRLLPYATVIPEADEEDIKDKVAATFIEWKYA